MPIVPNLTRHVFLVIATSLALVPGPAWARAPFDTWGKAGVTLEEYREDAAACGRSAYYADVSETDHAKAFVVGTRRLQAADDHSMGPAGASSDEEMYQMAQLGARSEQIRASVRPEMRMRELHAGLVSIVERCLESRGYSRFRLTREQQAQLRRLDKGSPERHRFLHMLASDTGVLASQRIE